MRTVAPRAAGGGACTGVVGIGPLAIAIGGVNGPGACDTRAGVPCAGCIAFIECIACIGGGAGGGP
jgi:hypothetical protein